MRERFRGSESASREVPPPSFEDRVKAFWENYKLRHIEEEGEFFMLPDDLRNSLAEQFEENELGKAWSHLQGLIENEFKGDWDLRR
ncbi:MAG: hypothetical protein HY398_00495 [Candidatus Doudnabacteria bacterium]|nr:hypothetical protein [Candidatus Doudnabacteria bacterium]